MIGLTNLWINRGSAVARELKLSGIRFPQNGCVSCTHLALCLGDQKLIEANLIRAAGGNDLAWLDELVD